jgi:hypothetical protein
MSRHFPLENSPAPSTVWLEIYNPENDTIENNIRTVFIVKNYPYRLLINILCLWYTLGNENLKTYHCPILRKQLISDADFQPIPETMIHGHIFLTRNKATLTGSAGAW